MEKKINIAEILKDCPNGMKLYSPIFGEGTLHKVTDRIHVNFQTEHNNKCFDVWGKYSKGGECMLFPSEEDRDWGKLQKTFKNGDIVATTSGTWIGITEGGENGSFIPTYCVIKSTGKFEAYFDIKEKWAFNRLATEEEKQKLFQAIKDNGYKWNAETKTLEKLKKEKFDITTLIPFESKVLVRDYDHTYWRVSFFGFFDKDECIYDTVRGAYKQCIPFKNNEHLLGKTDDCDEFYKTWE